MILKKTLKQDNMKDIFNVTKQKALLKMLFMMN